MDEPRARRPTRPVRSPTRHLAHAIVYAHPAWGAKDFRFGTLCLGDAATAASAASTHRGHDLSVRSLLVLSLFASLDHSWTVLRTCLSVVPSLAREALMRWWSCLGAESAEVLRAVYDGQHLT